MAGYANPDVLVETDWLAEHLDDPSIRAIEVDEDTAAYEKGHIKNAVGWNWNTDLHADLGLVYEVRISDQGDVDIEYTLTTMGCPIGPLIEDQMQAFLAAVPGIGEVRPEMVLRPPWSPEMMSDEAKAALGIF